MLQTCRHAAAGDPGPDPTINPLASSLADPDQPAVCGDLDSYVYCSLVSSLRLVAVPVVAIVGSGTLAAWDVVPRLRRRTGPGTRLAGVRGRLRWLFPPPAGS